MYRSPRRRRRVPRSQPRHTTVNEVLQGSAWRIRMAPRATLVGISLAMIGGACDPRDGRDRHEGLDPMDELIQRAQKHRLDERCESGRAVVDEGRQTVMRPVSACWAQIGDSLWYTYSDAAGHLLSVTWQIHVPSARLTQVSDSLRKALSQRYGEGQRCDPATFGGRYVLDLHLWTSEGLSIQML
jgi:hypothetical protein